MFGLLDKVVDTVEDFVDDPFETTIDIATQPIRDGIEVVEGLSEGELRTKAALRLGGDIDATMAVDELIDMYNEDRL